MTIVFWYDGIAYRVDFSGAIEISTGWDGTLYIRRASDDARVRWVCVSVQAMEERARLLAEKQCKLWRGFSPDHASPLYWLTTPPRVYVPPGSLPWEEPSK